MIQHNNAHGPRCTCTALARSLLDFCSWRENLYISFPCACVREKARNLESRASERGFTCLNGEISHIRLSLNVSIPSSLNTWDSDLGFNPKNLCLIFLSAFRPLFLSFSFWLFRSLHFSCPLIIQPSEGSCLHTGHHYRRRGKVISM